MADWKSANLVKILPPGTTTLIEGIEALLATIKTLLEPIKAILGTVKTFVSIFSFDLMDFLGMVRDLVEDFKNDLKMGGMYICNMLDYPLKQLSKRKGYNHTFDYSTLTISGDSFVTSYLNDLASSFNDANDYNKPTFKSDCAMLVLVAGAPSMEELNITYGDGGLGDLFEGLGGGIGSANREIFKARARLMFSKFMQSAKLLPSDKIATRTKRLLRSFKMFNWLDSTKLDGVHVHFNPTTGKQFAEGIDPSNLNWEEDILPTIESIEEVFRNASEYPDWNSITLKDIVPSMVNLIDAVFDPVLDLLETGYKFDNFLDKLVKVLENKITFLGDLVYRIDVIMEKLEFLMHYSGFNALFVNTSGGIQDLNAKLLNAGNMPFKGNNFYTGFTLISGGPQVTAFNAFFGPVTS